jgi:hypothetical protein
MKWTRLICPLAACLAMVLATRLWLFRADRPGIPVSRRPCFLAGSSAVRRHPRLAL